MTFEYEPQDRNDIVPHYEGGSVIKTMKRLRKISTSSGRKVRDYWLTYDYGGAVGRSRLVSLQECGEDGACMPATTIGWRNGGAGNFTHWTNHSTARGAADGYEHHFADVNGDGIPDWIQIGRSSDDCYVGTGNGDGTFNHWTYSYVSCGAVDSYEHQFSDVNGDGRTDWIRISRATNQGWVALANANGSFTFWTNHSTSRGAANGHAHYFADVNGDGLPDWIQITRASNNCWVGIGNGDGSFNHWTYDATYCGAIDRFEHHFADVNADGRTDWIQVARATNEGWVALANPNGSFTFWTNYSTARGAVDGHVHYFADVNGDGLPDWIQVTRGTNNGWVGLADGPSPDLLSSVTNGLGVVTTISYKPLTDNSVYTKDANAGYPYQDLQNATAVVASVSTTNGIGGQNTTTYQYGGLKAHHTASTSLGFRWTQTTDSAGLIHVTYHNQNREQGIDGTVAVSETYASGVRVKYTTNTWATAATTCNGIAGTNQPRLTASYDETRELNNSLIVSVTTTTAYDNCGHPTTVVSTANDSWKKTVTNTYSHDTTNWILGLVTQAQVTAEAPGVTAQTRTSSFSYTNGLLVAETIEPDNTALSLTTTYAYDNFGNRTGKTTSGQGMASRTESQSYDPTGRFVVSRTNALGHTATFDHDPRNGQLTRQTDPNGLTTTSDYDGFGRKGIETRPDGTSTTITYSATDSGYLTLVQSAGTAPIYTYFDRLGREIRSATNGFGGNWIYRDKTYDALGRVTRVSRPDFSNPPSYGTDVTYDVLGRTQTVTQPGNRTTTTTYNGLTTTVTNPLGQTKTAVNNSQGKAVSITDAGGTTSYQYDAFGNLTQVTDPQSNAIAMQYDLRGRKIAMQDPDMGAWSYSYNVLGELTSQTDAKAVTTSMTYDKLGRLQTRSAPEGASQWTYDTAAHGIGKLTSVVGPDGYEEQYAYDDISRPTQVDTKIGGQFFTVGTGYDAYGRVCRITYPTGYQVLQVYDAYGHLWQVQKFVPAATPVTCESSGTRSLLWQTDAADANSRVIQETFGNGVIGQRLYNPETGDLAAILSGTGGANIRNIQDLSYSVDAIGNLKTRGDAIANLTESFDYDNLNRLTTATGAVTKTYQYDAIGNITHKSDVGNYAYNTSGPNSVRPHAVKTISGTLNTTYTYDANGNLLTGAGRTLTYTSFNKPATVTANGQSTTLTYDTSYHRIQKITATKATVYLGKLYERQTTGTLVEQKHYIYGGSSLVAVYTNRNNNTNDTRYLHTNHLDSVDVITDENANVVERLSFDPHGKRRQTNGQDATGTIASTVNRGFTRHEHDDEIGLINMNARLYDPVIGRFITPDTVVESSFGQGLNRYSYVRNNPLSLTDPSGHRSLRKFFKKLQGAVEVYVGWLFIAATPECGPVCATVGAYLMAKGAQHLNGCRRACGSEVEPIPVVNYNSGPRSEGGGWNFGSYSGRSSNSGGFSFGGGSQSSVPDVGYRYLFGSNYYAPASQSRRWMLADAGTTVTDVGNQLFNDANHDDEFYGVPAQENIQEAGCVSAGSFDVCVGAGAITRVGAGLSRVARFFGFGTRAEVTIGANANQISHAFRHVDELGLSRNAVSSAIQTDIAGANLSRSLQVGQGVTRSLTVDGQQLTYRAHRVNEDIINVGRITGP